MGTAMNDVETGEISTATVALNEIDGVNVKEGQISVCSWEISLGIAITSKMPHWGY